MFTIVLMSNSDLFDKLYQEINRQNTFYFWVVGIVVSVAIAIAAFFGILQWRLSDKQIQKMKNETRQELEELYQFNNMRDKINELKDDLVSAKRETASLKQEVEKLRNNISDNNQSISSLLKAENDIENNLSNKINVDPATIYYSFEKTMIESDVISLMYTDNDNEAENLSNRIKDKMKNIIEDESIGNLDKSMFLLNISNRLKLSNKEKAKVLGEYLSQNYKFI